MVVSVSKVSNSLWLAALAVTKLSTAQSQDDPGGVNSFTNSNGGVPWAQAQQLAAALVAQMTPEEQNNITYGYSAGNGCSGVSGPVSRLNYSGLCLQDSGNGVRGTDLVTGFASGVHAAASWNVDLAYERAVYMGAEFKRKGAHLVNGPVVGPMGRIALDGRAWEGLGIDPYANGKLANSTVLGLQQSVITAVKHYIGNEQETDRNPSNGSAISSDMDDVTLHEQYLWPFQDAVRAGAGSIMCSYNKLNGTYACSNNYTLNTVLKEELAFPGFVLSDWTAQHDGTPSANAGLDMAMPNSPYWQDGQLVTATQNGSLSSERLADMATRILASWYHIFNGPQGDIDLGVGIPSNLLAPHDLIEGRDPASKASTRQSAVEGHVLVKNVNNALPLNKPKILSLFGYDATVAPVNYPTTQSFSAYDFGIQSVNITTEQDIAILIGGGTVPESATLGTVISGGGSGAVTSSYWSDPYSAVQWQAYEDDTFLWWDFMNTSPSVSAASDACLVFVNEDASEGADRPGLADPDSDTLIENVASQCANTIVIIHNVWIRTVDSWIDHPNITAVIYAHLPGQDSGRALVDVLYARNGTGPSGRLPYTVAKSAFDYGPLLLPVQPEAGDPNPTVYYQEGVDIDYKYFLAHNITPRFQFGYGLTYSNFTYSGVSSSWLVQEPPTTAPNPDVIAPGGITSLFDDIASVTATIQNTGAVAASEVAQLYVQFPGDAPLRSLRGFTKEYLQPGESKQVSFPLTRRDLSKWNTATQGWELQSGQYDVYVGKDVLDAALLSCSLSR